MTYVQIASGLLSVRARRNQHSAAFIHRILSHEFTAGRAVIIGALMVALRVDVVDLHPEIYSSKNSL